MDPIELLASTILAFAPTTPVSEAVERAERALSAVRAHRPVRGIKSRPRRGEEHYVEQFRAILTASVWGMGRSELLAKVRGNVKRVRVAFEGMLARGELVQHGEGRKAGYQLSTWEAPTGDRLRELLAKHAEEQAKK